MTNATTSPDLQVLIFAASLRDASLNNKLAALAARVARENGATVDMASMRDFDVPLYDGDLETQSGIPEGDNLEAFLSLAEAAKHYPCIQKAWVEFLGETPGEGADRVDPPTTT